MNVDPRFTPAAGRQRVFNLPPVLVAAIAVLFAVHILREYVLGREAATEFLLALAFIPIRVVDAAVVLPGGTGARIWTFVSYALLHADWSHLLFNMITLYFFGRQIEEVMAKLIGPLGFVLFYLSAIVIAILPTYLRHRHDAHYRSLGASGAVSAVLFAFILLSPWSLIIVFFLPMPAILYAVAYVAYSIWMDKRGGDNINHGAHLAGAAYGVLFLVVMDTGVIGHFLQELSRPSFG